MSERLIEGGGLLLLPRLQVQNANAISGPLTWGFPAPTAFTGFVHALERRLQGRARDEASHLEHGLGGVGIVCHRCDAQVSQPAGRRTQVFSLTRNPLFAGWKRFENKPAAIVEEGRIHLEISLVIVVKDVLGQVEGDCWAQAAHEIVQGMRLAGGSVLPVRQGERYQASWWMLPDNRVDQEKVFHKLRRRLLPGFALVQRDDLLAARLAELRAAAATASALDAFLDLSRLTIEPAGINPERPDEVVWRARSKPGWLVPLAIGYAGLSDLYSPGVVANSRDQETPFRFVESLYSVGEWVSPHRLEQISQLLWQTEEDLTQGIYRCCNRYVETSPIPPIPASHKDATP